ncbi:hypothetical protein QJQ45_028551 [Haematococcus lacustris]|nr:hypothetical protein QJQ45_028551 [Haematococcus lacustris]
MDRSKSCALGKQPHTGATGKQGASGTVGGTVGTVVGTAAKMLQRWSWSPFNISVSRVSAKTQADYHHATKQQQPSAPAVVPKIQQLPAVPQPVPRRKPHPLRTPPLGQPPSPLAPPPTALASPGGSAPSPLDSVLARINSLVLPTTPYENKLHAHCRAVCEALRAAGNSCPLPDLALALRAQGWVTLVRKVSGRLEAAAVSRSTAWWPLWLMSHQVAGRGRLESSRPDGRLDLQAWTMPRLSAPASSHPCLVQVIDSQAYWTKSMTNSFCYCLLPLGSGSGPGPKHQGYVVDPAIKDYFQAAAATPRYQAVWGALPEVFVGPASQLVPLLQLLCAERAACFQAQGRQLPPWRSFTATQGRWLSPSFQDVAAPAVAPSPGLAGSSPTSTCHSRGSPASSGSDVSALAAFRAACAQLLQPSAAGPQQQAGSQAHGGASHSSVHSGQPARPTTCAAGSQPSQPPSSPCPCPPPASRQGCGAGQPRSEASRTPQASEEIGPAPPPSEPPDPPPAAAEAVILRGPALVSAGLTVSASSAASQALLVLRGFSPPLHEGETATVLPGSSVQSGQRSSDSRVRLRQAGPGLGPPWPWPAVPAQGPGGPSVSGPGGVQGSAFSCTVPGPAAGAQAQAAGLGLGGALQAWLGGGEGGKGSRACADAMARLAAEPAGAAPGSRPPRAPSLLTQALAAAPLPGPRLG